MALPPICRCATRNVRRDKPRCVKQFRIVVAARATEVGAKPSVRYDLRRRDLPWGWFCAIRIRQTTLQAARHGGRACHNLSLTATLQMLGNLRLSNAIRGVDLGMCELFLEHQSTITVGHRPGRNQPRRISADPKPSNVWPSCATKPKPNWSPSRESNSFHRGRECHSFLTPFHVLNSACVPLRGCEIGLSAQSVASPVRELTFHQFAIPFQTQSDGDSVGSHSGSWRFFDGPTIDDLWLLSILEFFAS